MEFINIYIGGIGVSLMIIVYLAMCLVMYYSRDRFRIFPTEPGGIVVNGIVGMAGYLLYILNIPLTGTISPLLVLVPSNCLSLCDDAQSTLATYALTSTLRFVCWYLEAVNSFLFVMIFLGQPVKMILIRYGLHTLNLLLSVASLILASDKEFPNSYIAGGNFVSPVVVQMVILLFVILSYFAIFRSRLYRITWDPIMKERVRKLLAEQTRRNLES